MAGLRLGLPRAQILDLDGNPRAEAKLYVYENTTTTPVELWTDRDLSEPAANPVEADSEGFFSLPFIDSEEGQLFTLVAYTADDELLWSHDDVEPAWNIAAGSEVPLRAELYLGLPFGAF